MLILYMTIDSFSIHLIFSSFQTKICPAFVLFFDCSEEEMERRLLGRNQVLLCH
jgi:hypothetical protein